MTTGAIVMLVGSAMALFLALRGLRSHGLSFENKAWMAAVWAVVIGVLAFVLSRMGF